MSDQPFSDDELERYARHLVLPEFGGLGQQRLRAAKVAVIGAGGVSSGVLPALDGAGIGQLTIVDPDRVDVSNLQRQTLFKSSQVGMGKALLAAQFVQERNPFIAVDALVEKVTRDNARDLISSHDLVVDGTDNFAARLAISDACTGLEIPLLSAAAQQFQGQVALFRGKPCYRCFVGDAFDNDECDTCAELGVMAALTGTVGGFAALLAIRALAGMADDAGTLHLFDAKTLEWRRIAIPADPRCRTCA